MLLQEVKKIQTDSVSMVTKLDSLNTELKVLGDKIEAKQKEYKSQKKADRQKLNRALTISSLLILGVIFLFTFRERQRLQRSNGKLKQKQKALEQLNKTLKQQNEELGVLKRELSHRVKNSLMAIGSRISSQIRKLRANAQADLVTPLSESHSRIQAIQLLYTQLQYEENTNDINLQSYLEDLAKYLQSAGYYSKQHFITEINLEQAPLVQVGLASRLGLALTELVLNAIKYTITADKQLNLQASLQDNKFFISVADNGPGMPDSISYGIGLNTVKTIVEKQLGGKLKLDKEHSGAKWLISIPLAKLASRKRKNKQVAPAPLT